MESPALWKSSASAPVARLALMRSGSEKVTSRAAAVFISPARERWERKLCVASPPQRTAPVPEDTVASHVIALRSQPWKENLGHNEFVLQNL
jgi:hypothetical protein